MPTLLGRPHAFERGDKLYLTTPLALVKPTEQQVEEYAFASAVKTKAPNENIGWLSGRYVEAERANLNNAMWLSDELALKSLTPMLMPVTVMHDPRTAVGTIADCKFIAENASTRIDTVLGIWRHRFPEVWEEASADIQRGQLMQSMETFTPWYTCSECEQAFVKLPQGAERASWCDHLRNQQSRRILRDVCFTGTGLIFGSRGGVGAYTDAHLDHFHEEIAEYHDRAHVDSSYRPTQRRPIVGIVQIEESELATLRRERDEAKGKVEQLSDANRTLTTKAETAEVAQKRAETERDAEKVARTSLEEKATRASNAKTRTDALGAGFLAKLGDTSKAVLSELAASATDEQWELALKEREELAQVKRDAQAPGTPAPSVAPGQSHSQEEVASFLSRVPGNGGNGGNSGGTPAQDGALSVRQLARSFAKGKTGARQ